MPSNTDEHPWSTWSDSGLMTPGLFVLADVRKNLLDHNLHDPHVDYFGYNQVDCRKQNRNYRSADGSCYYLNEPLVGAAGVAFGRNVPPNLIDQDAASKLMHPDPSEVSKVLFTRDEFKPVPFLNMIAATWIQFMNHDWLSHGKNVEGNPYIVPGAGVAAEVDRTRVNTVPDQHYKPEFGKTTINEVTHWWDGSQLYGSSQHEQNKLRTFKDGKLITQIVNGKELLPRDDQLNPANNRQNHGAELTGFRENWWVGLSLLHTLFVKEHNAIAEHLYSKYVKEYNASTKKHMWKEGLLAKEKYFTSKELDEHIFQLSRLINAAVMAKIHTVEWTPAILPNDTLKLAMYTNWYGLANPITWMGKHLPSTWRRMLVNRTDWSKIKSGYVIGGVVGDKQKDFGVPYSITEEFTSVYRLHSLLPDTLNFKKLQSPQAVTSLAFTDTRNEKSYEMMKNNELKDMFYSFGTQNPGQLVLNNFPEFMQKLTIPGRGTMDLGMVDIMRDRERKVPRYNQFRRGLRLKPISKYTDFFPGGVAKDDRQKEILSNLIKVYGPDTDPKNIESIDLLVGTLAEEVRPASFGFGETMFQVFILMASRRLMADRFFTDDYNEDVYTPAGMNWIDTKGTLADVIIRHMPALEPKLQGVATAFNPWKE